MTSRIHVSHPFRATPNKPYLIRVWGDPQINAAIAESKIRSALTKNGYIT